MAGSIERAWVSSVFVGALLLGCGERTPVTGNSERVATTSSALVWGSERKLLPNEGVNNFGDTVSLSGTTALIGGPSATDDAYVFVRSGKSWSQQQKLTTGGPTYVENFGYSLALSGDIALIGAPEHVPPPDTNTGAAYVFARSGTTWSEQQILTDSDGLEQAEFGCSVALSGDTAIIGALASDVAGDYAGAAYVFVRNGTTWSEQQRLTASDAAPSNQYGAAVALAGNTALVGSYLDDNGGNNGSVYVYVRSGTVWSEQQKLTASEEGFYFGWSVAISGDTAVIGNPKDDDNGDSSGSVYVFVRSGTVWSEQQKFTASYAQMNDNFGHAVAVQGDLALIGANDGSTAGYGNGTAYIFTRSGTVWSETAILTASDGQDQDRFGGAVSLSGEEALVGASRDDHPSGNNGSAYWFTTAAENGTPCTLDTECASNFCVDGFCCNQDCTGACAACSMEEGSPADGYCQIFGQGEVGSPDCAPLTCNGFELDCGECLHDTGCVNGKYCTADGTCLDQKELGDACNLSAGVDCLVADCRACESAHCADGVCCDAACDGELCEACLGSLTGGSDGTCQAIPEGEDPQNECDPTPGFPCQADGVCSGAQSCRPYAPDGIPCGATDCVDGVVSGHLCNGSGACLDQGSFACAPYACGVDACFSDCSGEEHCDADHYCNEGSCVSTFDDGAECTEDLQCTNRHCVDGVCCNDACEGQCSACTEADSVGQCIAVSGVPRGDRDPCSGDLAVCGGECSGENLDECSYPGETRSCGSACSDGLETRSACDGEGACAELEPTPCGNYVCGADSCLTECAANSDCVTGYVCAEAVCVPLLVECSMDGSQSLPSDGPPVPCTPYLCDRSTGACHDMCNDSSECASGLVCNPENSQCERTTQASGDDGGCGCRTPGRSAPRGAGLLLLVGLGLLGLRRGKLTRPAAG